MDDNKPLAYRLRPKKLEDFIGQEEIVGKDKLLYRTIKADRLSSLILWGPPGCGKTSLAKVISETTKYKFIQLNAVTAGVQDIKNTISEAENVFLNPTGKCILFIDEIHRFNKLQQDALLPFVEDGTVILIGATTENPYFEVNKALISRSMVIRFEPLKDEDIIKIVKNAIKNPDGLGNYKIKISDDTIKKIAEVSNGDVRTALNGLEVAVSHYDNISAFIKSIRGSDPDAAIFYLARALNAGEDPMFLARRIVISSAEDIGMANPNALVVANSAMQAVSMVGMPEARIILAEAVVYLATSPKSNASYLAINKALSDVSSKDTGSIPMHIRNAPAEGMSQFGYGEGYKYPHDYPGHVVEQQYLPDAMLGTKYYIKDENCVQ